MSVKFDDWGYEAARRFFDARRKAQLTHKTFDAQSFAAENRRAYNGDHWQEGKWFIGQMPDRGVEGYYQRLLEIKDGFQVENVIKETVDTHLGGAFGREPTMDYVPRKTKQPRRSLSSLFRRLASRLPRRESEPEKDAAALEADETFTEWWDVRNAHGLIREGGKQTLLEESAVYRFYVPGGLRDKLGVIPVQSQLSDAARFVFLNIHASDAAAVLTDEDTEAKVGIFLYSQDGQSFAELTYLDADGKTVVRQVGEKNSNPAPRFTYNLGGHLTMYEVRREPLITEAVRSNQKAVNLALTQLMRNVNLAGSRERVFMSAEAPGVWVDAAGNEWVEGTSVGKKKWKPFPYYTGAGVTNFINGKPLRDKDNRITDYTNPNLNVIEPVAIDTFTGTRETFRHCIFAQCHMLHVLIADDATVSGRSREQARAEYESDLKITKGAFDSLGRWISEGVIYLAAEFCDRSNEFLTLRAEFNTLISTGPVSPIERQENRADVEKGVISLETARSRGGVDDPQAEAARIKQEQEERRALPNEVASEASTTVG